MTIYDLILNADIFLDRCGCTPHSAELAIKSLIVKTLERPGPERGGEESNQRMPSAH